MNWHDKYLSKDYPKVDSDRDKKKDFVEAISINGAICGTSYSGTALGGMHITFLTPVWGNFYWDVFQYGFFIDNDTKKFSHLFGGTFGGRIPLSVDYKHELRIGAEVGVSFFSEPAFMVAPTIVYLWHCYRYFYLNVGFENIINIVDVGSKSTDLSKGLGRNMPLAFLGFRFW